MKKNINTINNFIFKVFFSKSKISKKRKLYLLIIIFFYLVKVIGLD